MLRPPCLRCFHRWGANLMAQEEGVYALFYKDWGSCLCLCVGPSWRLNCAHVSLWSALHPSTVSRTMTYLKISSALVCLGNTIFCSSIFCIRGRRNEIRCCFTRGIGISTWGFFVQNIYLYRKRTGEVTNKPIPQVTH